MQRKNTKFEAIIYPHVKHVRYLFFMCVSMKIWAYVHTRAPRVQKTTLDLLELEFQEVMNYLTGVLWTELGPCERVVHILTSEPHLQHWTSPYFTPSTHQFQCLTFILTQKLYSLNSSFNYNQCTMFKSLYQLNKYSYRKTKE